MNATRIRNTKLRLLSIGKRVQLSAIGGLKADVLERWLALRTAEGMSAGNRNEFRQELVGFGNWCVRTDRMIANPFTGVPKADGRADQRRQRRSLTEDELTRLLYVAQLRPLAEYGRETIRKDAQHSSGRRTWRSPALEFDAIDAAVVRALDRLRSNPEFANRLETLGRGGLCLQNAGSHWPAKGRAGVAHRRTGARRGTDPVPRLGCGRRKKTVRARRFRSERTLPPN